MIDLAGYNAIYGNVFVLKGTNYWGQFLVFPQTGLGGTLDIYNNTFAAIGTYPTTWLNTNNGRGAYTLNIKNNIIYNAFSSGTAICARLDGASACGTSTATINHSHNTWKGFASNSWSGETCSAWAGIGEKCDSDPLFSNYANGDFSLPEGSIAMDAGIDLGSEYKQQLKPGSTWPNLTLITPSIMSIGAYGNDTSSTKRPMPPIIEGIR